MLASTVQDDQAFAELDEHMQALLVLAQGRARKTSYLSKLKELKRAWDALEVGVAAASPAPPRGPKASETQARILDTLERVCPPAAASYAQALTDIASDRRSWRGTAAEFREALRELLDKLAPDDDVMKVPGFKLEPDAKGIGRLDAHPSERFILKAREQSSDVRKAVEESVNVIEEQVGAFVRSVYNRASGSVHVQRTKQEVVSIQRFVETALVELLQL